MKEWPYRLLAPGPVQLPPEVKSILARDMIHHRTPEFSRVLVKVLANLKKVFATTQDVIMHASTGSGAMESAVVNCFSPGDEVLVIVSGKFGSRWAEMCEGYGLKVSKLEVPWGHAVDPRAVEKALKNPNIMGVFCQACETSTAVLHPIKEIADQVKDRPQTLMLVDAITAIGSTPLPMDSWHLDVVVAGSQKAFMLPTGLGFIALSQKAWTFYEQAKLPKFYFDAKAELQANRKGDTHFSSTVPLTLALDWVLEKWIKDGLDTSIRRCETLARSLGAAMDVLGLQPFSKAPSPSVTAIVVPPEVDGSRWRDLLESKYNLTVMGGQDQLKGKILRVGHLGYITDEDQIGAVEALGLSLKELSIQIALKQIERATAAAAQVLAEKS